MSDNCAGFQEIEHTADWALQIWAPTLGQLFSTAAAGMAHLMEITLAPGELAEKTVVLEGMDPESLLVAFLSELLYLGEGEGLGMQHCEVEVAEDHLRAHIWAAPLQTQKKEIKAVTYHNLKIQHHNGLYRATVVFDV